MLNIFHFVLPSCFFSSSSSHLRPFGSPAGPPPLLQDVDTIYLTQDTRELNLQDFVHLENRYEENICFSCPPFTRRWFFFFLFFKLFLLLVCLCRDLVAIIAALEHNQWFTKLSTKDYKLVTLVPTAAHVKF